MGVLKKLTSEYFGVSVRKDEGMVFDIGGKKYIMLFEDYRFIRNLIPLDDDGRFFIRKEFSFLDEPGYVCCAHMGGDKHYNHAYDYYIISESVLENVRNHTIDHGVVSLLDSNDGDHDENFLVFDILEGVGGIDLYDGITVTRNVRYVEVSAGYKSCRIYTDEDYARADAVDECESDWLYDYIDSMPIKEFERQRGFSDDWIDTDSIRDSLRDDFSGYYKEESDDEYGCRLYAELVSHGVIQNNSEYFDVDIDEPIFDPDDYKDELVERVADEDGVSHDEAVDIVDEYDDEEFIQSLIKHDIIKKTDEYFELDHDSPLFYVDDKIDEMVDKFGDNDLIEWLEELYTGYIPGDYYDLKKLAESCVDVDGVGHFLMGGSEEHSVDVDGVSYLVYIQE